MQTILQEELPRAMDFEEGLRNGVYLAKLAHYISPETVPLSRIYDPDQNRYKTAGLQFRHTDNINYWLRSLEAVKLPKVNKSPISSQYQLTDVIFSYFFRYFILKPLTSMIRRTCLESCTAFMHWPLIFSYSEKLRK